MISITIYMEGGGDGAGGRAALRQGMDAFLRPIKEAARRKALRWKLVSCGPRSETYRRFQNAVGNAGPEETNILLVDADELVTQPPRAHLSERKSDNWDLSFADERTIHLMAQVMETWIVADPEALTGYYGQDFKAAKLPKRQDLEQEPKERVLFALKNATKGTKKRAYHKIRHARELLKQLDAAKVKARCRHCERLFEELGRFVEAA